jgi:oligoendopeptidase F
MKRGFPDEPAKLLKSDLGIDLADPNTIDRIFSIVETKLSEFERKIQNVP